MKATKEVCFALNVLIWKVGVPYGYQEQPAHTIADFYISELADKGMTGLAWDDANSEFVLQQ